MNYWLQKNVGVEFTYNLKIMKRRSIFLNPAQAHSRAYASDHIQEQT
jgi:hypothetical protein